jgi:hypothetical protein
MTPAKAAMFITDGSRVCYLKYRRSFFARVPFRFFARVPFSFLKIRPSLLCEMSYEGTRIAPTSAQKVPAYFGGIPSEKL